MMTLETQVRKIPQLSDDFVNAYANQAVPWGPIGYVVFKRTYARKHKNRTEEWHETTERCVNNILRLAKGAISLEEGEALFDHVFNLRATFSGRAMWQLGTSTVDRLGGASLTNCWNVSARSLDIFPFMFDMLMLGGGVGFNIQREHIFKLPPVKKAVQVIRQDSKDADFIVPDTREGWVELLRRTLDSFFTSGVGFTYSTICIRGAGTPISGFGGVASGPDSLCKGLEQICIILRHRAGKQLRSIDVLDICNIIGSIVVAGNVRRSAELALGDPDDFTFLRAKNWANDKLIPNWRSMSNNTIIVNKFDHIPAEFWNSYQPDTGEPYGLFNRNLSRAKGRLVDTHRSDPDISGTNPCSEISLCDFEPCNLSEIYLPNIKDEAEFISVATAMYKVCKVITTLPYHWAQSEEIIKKNRRIGLGLTGFLQAPKLTSKETLTAAYQAVEAEDRIFSRELSKSLGETVRESIKLTTIKPSGTASLLAGVSPGIHPEYAPFYLRRVRMSATDVLVKRCHEAGYRTERALHIDGSVNHDTVIVEFPIKARKSSILAKDLTAIQMLEQVKHAQTYWSDNAVSCTVYYHESELPEIQKWLSENYEGSVKAVSFLLKKNHGFVQAPLEEITEQEFLERSSKLKPMQYATDLGGDALDSQECAGGACPIK